MAKTTATRPARWPGNIFFGWWIVAVSVIADGLKHGTFNRGFTIYVLPIRAELGLSLAAISLADMLGRLVGGFQGPVVGYLTDRWGPRTLLALGALVSGLGFILLFFVHSYFFFLLVFIGLLSVGFRSGYNNASVAAVNRWFLRKRSLAMSIVSVGNGLGGAFAPIVGLLVITIGWRPAVLYSGLLIIVLICPLSLLLRDNPESMGLLPDGDRPDPSPTESESGGITAGDGAGTAVSPALPRINRQRRELDFTVGEAMHTPTYWFIVLAVGLRNSVHSGLSFLLAPVMVWFLEGAGRPETERWLIASVFVMALSFSTIVFNPSVGWLGDKYSKQKLSSFCMIAGAVALVTLLNHSGNLWQLLIFAILLALSESANPLAWAIMGDFFGRRSFATLRGWQHLPDQLMSMSTPVWMGIIFDRTGSFYWALLPLIILYLLAAISYWAIPSPGVPARLLAREEAIAGD